MPIYEYTCDKCDREFELLIRTDSDKPLCPECGTTKVIKRLSVPAAHTAASSSLNICDTPKSGGCGLPQCGGGQCLGMG
jgi:putative FmdB family regulatory protein